MFEKIDYYIKQYLGFSRNRIISISIDKGL